MKRNSCLSTARLGVRATALASRIAVCMATGSLVESVAEGALLTFSVGNVPFTQGSSTSVPIEVSGFTDVTTVQWTLEWDSGVLQYTSVGNLGLMGLAGGNFGYDPLNPNRLTLSWDDPNGLGVTKDLGSTIFSVNFNVIGNPGSSTALRFSDDPVPREVSVAFAAVDQAEIAWVSGDTKVVTQTPGDVKVVTETVNTLVALGCLLGAMATVRWALSRQILRCASA